MSRQTRAVIHLKSIVDNFTQMNGLNLKGDSIAVIKANAYGHGAVSVARALSSCKMFAVAIIKEALLLREANISQNILVLQGPHQSYELNIAFEQRFSMVIHNEEQLAWLYGIPQSRWPNIWIKVDTGMHRLGFSTQRVKELWTQKKELFKPNHTLMTHFHSADSSQACSLKAQIEEFRTVSKKIGCLNSLANSAASITDPDSHSDWNRIGIAMYGSSTLPKNSNIRPNKLAVGMTLEASIIALRDIKSGEPVGYDASWVAPIPSKIATVGIGYADGYPRHITSGTPVFVNGTNAYVVGRVSMDMITIDVSQVPNPQIGDKVELWGENISVDLIASKSGTIGYELLTRVSERVPRVFKLG